MTCQVANCIIKKVLEINSLHHKRNCEAKGWIGEMRGKGRELLYLEVSLCIIIIPFYLLVCQKYSNISYVQKSK